MDRTGPPTLVLVPTPAEREGLSALGGLGEDRGPPALCGFGPVAAAARTAALVERLAPGRVLLVGIAGTFDEGRLALGEACAFGSVVLDGVGVGEGAREEAEEGDGPLTPSALGLPQWAGGDGTGSAPIHERLPLAAPGGDGPGLLTVCSASADPRQAARRRERFPGAAAEDMEAFGAALACALAGVPLSVVRGASNRVGDRDRGGWHWEAALAAARDLALALLEESP